MRGEEHDAESIFTFTTAESTAVTPGYTDNLALAASTLEKEDRLPAMLTSSDEQVDSWLERSRSDLNMLLAEVPSGIYPYAGVPWFSRPSGRDGIIIALECLWMTPQMARGVLAYLIATQNKGSSPEQFKDRLTAEADQLQERFEPDFWCDAIGTYAIALDGEKNPCRVRTSNAGQCLFTGIAEKSNAAAVANQLNSDSFFSGWGIRTVAAAQPRYNPMSYHNGSVWLHDNALMAAGFTRYGLTKLAARVLEGIFAASAWFDLNRLLELFCGFNRRADKAPTSYPVACSPQAWLAGAAFLLLQASIGLSIDAIENRIVLAYPVLPPFLQQVHIRNLAVRDASVDLSLFRSGDTGAVTPPNIGRLKSF